MKFLFLFLALFHFNAHSRVGELISLASDQGGYPTDAMCFFSNNEMAIYKDGVLLKYTCLGKPELYSELWYVGPMKQNVLLVRSELGNLLYDAVVSGDKIFITEFSEFETVALWEHDLTKLTKHSLPQSWKRYMIQDLASMGERLWMRFRDDSGMYGEAIFNNDQWDILPERGVSFNFSTSQTPDMVIQKIRMGMPGETEEERPDYIQIKRSPEFQPEMIVGDVDADPKSPFKSFRNHVNSQGHQWFVIARTNEGEVAVRGKDLSYEIIPLYKYFKTIDYWPGALLNDGSLVLRGILLDGTKGLFTINEGAPKPIILHSDSLEIEEGTFEISSQSMFYNAPVSDGIDVYIGLGIQDVAQGIFKFRP